MKNPSTSKPKGEAVARPSPYETRDHENQTLNDDDIFAVASLFNRVGGELTEVDHQNVGGSSIRAQKLDPSAVLDASKISSTSPAAIPQNPPTQNPQPPVQSPAKQETPPVTHTSDVALLKRIETLETTVANLSKLHDNILKRLSKNPKKITISLT